MSDYTVLRLYNLYANTYTTTIENVDVLLTFFWNTRTAHYHMDMQLRDGTYLLQGQKMVVGSPVLSTAMYSAGIVGNIVVVPLNDNVEETTDSRKGWSSNYALSYIA